MGLHSQSNTRTGLQIKPHQHTPRATVKTGRRLPKAEGRQIRLRVREELHRMHYHFFAYGKELRTRIHGDNENTLRLRIQRPGMTHVLKPVLLLKEVDAGSACDDYASRVDRKRTLRLIQVNEAPRKTLHPSKQRRVAPTNRGKALFHFHSLIVRLDALDRRHLEEIIEEDESPENLRVAVQIEGKSKVQEHAPERAPVPVPRHHERAQQRRVERPDQLGVIARDPLPRIQINDGQRQRQMRRHQPIA